MTPAEELRAAAIALRCEHSWSVANVAPPGPCEICAIPWSESPVVAGHVAEQLADLLGQMADDMDGNEAEVYNLRRLDGEEWIEVRPTASVWAQDTRSDWTSALLVARDICGRGE